LIGARPYRGKRLVDLAVLLAVALPAGAIGAVAALAVRLTSPGPVMFHQQRVGMNGQPFDCLKFRTMVHGDNPLIPDSSRITSAGRWLRRFSLDELPQLLNVARGDMSVVGPRPMLPFQAERCDRRQARRFAVRPGLTGWAQVNGRNSVDWPSRIELDLDYVERQSPLLDLRIIAGTARALVSGSGVEGHDPDDPFVIPVPAEGEQRTPEPPHG
jgi:lipopolysaccharide/colanic/teichoic acid biosynthesis glycosyltransferase